MEAHYEPLCRYLVFSGLYAVLACALHTQQTLHHQASSQVQLRRVHLICSGPSLNVGPWDTATVAVWLALLPRVSRGKCHSTWYPLSGSRCCGQHGQCALSVCTPSPVKTSPCFWCARGKGRWLANSSGVTAKLCSGCCQPTIPSAACGAHRSSP